MEWNIVTGSHPPVRGFWMGSSMRMLTTVIPAAPHPLTPYLPAHRTFQDSHFAIAVTTTFPGVFLTPSAPMMWLVTNSISVQPPNSLPFKLRSFIAEKTLSLTITRKLHLQDAIMLPQWIHSRMNPNRLSYFAWMNAPTICYLMYSLPTAMG